MKRLLLIPALLMMVALAMPAQQSSTKGETPAKPLSAHAATGSAVRAATDDPGYVIGPQDVLNISVWKEPDVSRTVPVRPDGKISLPLLDDVQAAGLTPMQLAATVTERLKKFIADPQVTIIVTEINSQRVYVMGQVMRAGAYPLLPNMTILQALSSAGGLSQFASMKKIYLLRVENGHQVKFPFNYKDVVSGRNPEQNLLVKPGDTIVVP